MNLSKSLFWDTEVKELDFDKHAKYVIDRVLHRGTWAEFKQIIHFYGKPRIKQIIKKLRYMDKRVLHFSSIYFDIPLKEIRCYNIRQSRKLHWDY